MRIGLIFPSIYASGELFGGRIFAPRDLLVGLADGLTKKGHEITVFSVPDLKTKANLVGISLDYIKTNPVIHKFRHIEKTRREWLNTEFMKRNYELNAIACAYDYARQGKIDLLHSYHNSSLFITYYFHSFSKFPTVYSLHDPLPPRGSFEYLELSKFKDYPHISLSNQMRKSDLKLNFVKTIYNGLDVESYSFCSTPLDYFLFMGRMVPEKGLHNAIAVALALNTRLKIGTQISGDVEKSFYFLEKIQPNFNNSLIEKPEMLQGEAKIKAYGQAKALLFPIEWEEPFGMVMTEAMASGTPVIAFNRGSVAEVVRDGITGFIVDQDDQDRPGKGSWIIKKQGIEGLIEAAKRIGEIHRKACRDHVLANFSMDKMVTDFEELYSEIINKHG
jgi:glycosyltransferase involved in cell wall biosynthesis